MTPLSAIRKLLPMGLAFSSSLIELGPVILAIKAGNGLLTVLLVGLAYQAGNALARVVPRHSLVTASFAVCGVVGSLLYPITNPMALVWLACISIALQASRRAMHVRKLGDSLSTIVKRAVRVSGFVISAIFPLVLSVVVTALLCLIAALWIARVQPANIPARQKAWFPVQRLHVIMVLHQVHYFSYCYTIPYLLGQNGLSQPWAIGAAFGAGWITYLSAETLFGKCRLRPTFIAGHAFVAVTLAGLAASSTSLIWTVTLWCLTGFGGGTVYCLTRLSNRLGLTTDGIEKSEDIGHIVGVAIAAASYGLFAVPAAFMPAIAAAFAVVACWLMVTWRGASQIGLRARTMAQA
jgi:hypothetical protein